MPNTSTDLANEALDKLGMIGIGQSPEAEDTEKVLLAYPRFKANLEAQGIFSIANDNDIDDAAFNWLAEYLAYVVSGKFQKPTDEGRRQAAEYHLTRISSSRPTREKLVVDYF